jgi:hypothetical protein
VCLVHGKRRSRISPCGFGAAHGKYDFHRVPKELHTAKFLAHGQLLVSGSASSTTLAHCLCLRLFTNDYDLLCKQLEHLGMLENLYSGLSEAA